MMLGRLKSTVALITFFTGVVFLKNGIIIARGVKIIS